MQTASLRFPDVVWQEKRDLFLAKVGPEGSRSLKWNRSEKNIRLQSQKKKKKTRTDNRAVTLRPNKGGEILACVLLKEQVIILHTRLLTLSPRYWLLVTLVQLGQR